MTKIYFIRHGETAWNTKRRYQGQTDIPLNEKGVMQTELIAQKLRGEKIDAVYASDLQRAYKTAEAIALEHGVSVNKEKGLREFHFGVIEGKTRACLQEDYPELMDWFKDPTKMNIPEAETITELQERAVKVVKKIIKDHKNETVVIASHGLTISVILCYFLNIEIKNAPQMIQHNTGIIIAEFDDAEGVLKIPYQEDYMGPY